MPPKPALECGREAAAFLSGDLSNYKIRRANGGSFQFTTMPLRPEIVVPEKGGSFAAALQGAARRFKP
jgi:hypothetical protein